MEQIKFKIFNYPDQCQWREGHGIKLFTEKVNDFLDSHEIIDVNQNQTTEKIASWGDTNIKTYISYIIKYKENKNE